MATWSITPSTMFVSIDNNGLLTYEGHDSDMNYTISYVGDDGCTASKELTIKKCDKLVTKWKVVDSSLSSSIVKDIENKTESHGNIIIRDINVEVNGDEKEAYINRAYIDATITESYVYIDGDGYYSATCNPTKIEGGGLYTLSNLKKVQHLYLSLDFNISGGFSGVYNFIDVRVELIKDGTEYYSKQKTLSCPCPGFTCTGGESLSSTFTFYENAYLDDIPVSIYDCDVKVTIHDAVARDGAAQSCNHGLESSTETTGVWTKNGETYTTQYGPSVSNAHFNLSFKQ